MQAHERLIVGMDGDWSLTELQQVARSFAGDVGMVKIGKRLFTRHGPEAVRQMCELGHKVFLDLKFHDIPNTVAQACSEAVRLGCSMLNVHAAGGPVMMKRAREAVIQTAAELGIPAPKLIAVTVLTSIDEEQLASIGIERKPSEQVALLAKLAFDCGLDGVVASPREIQLIREATGPDFLIVTPGVRPAGGVQNDDQKRVMTPADACKAGASYLVIGRPIIAAEDPAAAAREIAGQMEEI